MRRRKSSKFSRNEITKNMISMGMDTGIVSLEDSYAGEIASCNTLCCKIGNNAFYFAASEDEDLTKEQYEETYNKQEIVEQLYEMLKDRDTAISYGIYKFEYEYYKNILSNSKNIQKPIIPIAL